MLQVYHIRLYKALFVYIKLTYIRHLRLNSTRTNQIKLFGLPTIYSIKSNLFDQIESISNRFYSTQIESIRFYHICSSLLDSIECHFIKACKKTYDDAYYYFYYFILSYIVIISDSFNSIRLSWTLLDSNRLFQLYRLKSTQFNSTHFEFNRI